MSYSLSPWLKPRFFITGTNRPLAGGLMYTYEAGTTTNATTYSDDSGTPNTNPIVLNSDGECNLYLDDDVIYRIILKNAAGVTQFDRDNISANGARNKTVLSFENVANLRLAIGNDREPTAQTSGYYNAGDGGGNSFYWDDTSALTDNGGTVIKPTLISGSGRWLSLEKRITPNIFGAKGDGSNDDTIYIRAAVASLPTYGTLFGNPASTYKTSNRIDFINKNLDGLTLAYSTGNASIVLTGNAKLKDVVIYVGETAPEPFTAALTGAVNLHLADGAVIDNLTIPDGNLGTGVRVGIFCSTRASNVTVKNCTMDYIGWPLLYNDGLYTSPTSLARTVDGVNYDGATIGSGLTITDCQMGASDKTKSGDGIEINCPNYRFSDVRVSNCVVNRAVPNSTNGPNGIGMGFANIDRLLVDACSIKNANGSGGGLHCEHSVDVIFSNNMIAYSWKGIGVGNEGSNIIISNNTVIGSSESLQILGYNSPVSNVSIIGNNLLDNDTYPMVLTNITNCLISNNLFRNNGAANKAFITLLQDRSLTAKKITISNNNFLVDNGIDTIICSSGGTVTNVSSFGNSFSGVISNNVAGYLAAIRNIGVSDDYFDSTETGKGLHVKISRPPQGYLTGAVGDLATDITDGVIYRHNGTAWIPRMGLSLKGATSARPTLAETDVGVVYFDQTLVAKGKPIWWTGIEWVDSAGVAV